MGQYSEGMRAWAPELKEAVEGPSRPEGRGWYPAEVAAADEAAGVSFNPNIYTHSGDAGEEVWAASVKVGIDEAEVWVRPRDDSPSPAHEPMLLPTFLGYTSWAGGGVGEPMLVSGDVRVRAVRDSYPYACGWERPQEQPPDNLQTTPK